MDIQANSDETSTLELRKKIKDIDNKEKVNLIIYKVFKRIIDIVISIIGIILLVPLTIVIAIADIFVKDRGPVFYDQERIGKNGKHFKLYKYRSMVKNADDKLSKYLAENEDARVEYKKYKKLKNDPRVTYIGKIIRKTSIDEFPQFINVFKGEMSLVGPRPYLEREIEDMGERYNEIIKVKPGLTGLWQVNGRSETTFDDRTRIDTEYIQKRSLILDLKIFIRTFLKVFGKEGAK